MPKLNLDFYIHVIRVSALNEHIKRMQGLIKTFNISFWNSIQQ